MGILLLLTITTWWFCCIVVKGQIVNETDWFGSNLYEFYDSHTVLRKRDAAQTFCKNLGGFLVYIKSDDRINFLKKHIRPGTAYYIGITAKLIGKYDDGTIVPRFRSNLKNPVMASYVNRACVTATWSKEGKYNLTLVKCNNEHKFICQRKIGKSTMKKPMNKPNLATIVTTNSIPHMLRSNETFTTVPIIDMPRTSASMVGFAFDLSSFFIGVFITLPFLIFSIIVACKQNRDRTKVKKEHCVNKYAEIALNGSSYRSGDEQPQNQFHCTESPYVNVGGSSSNQYQMPDSGYERPISSSPEAPVHELQPYEEMQFSRY